MKIELKLHKNQIKIFQDKHRFKVIVCGRRFGKTWMSLTSMIIEAIKKPDALLWYIAPTYRQAKQIAWTMLASKLRDLPPGLVTKMNESSLTVFFSNGSKIELKGCDNDDSLRGSGLDGVILDEYATMKPRTFDEIIRPSLTDKKGWAWFVGTPKGYNHFWNLYNLKDINGEDLPKEEYAVFHFKSSDNPYLDLKEIEAAKRSMMEDAFMQEYEADFRKFTGLVYKEFERSIHVIKPYDIDQSWTRFVGIDFGYENPTAVLWAAIDNDGNWIIYDELYRTRTTIDEIIQIIKGRNAGRNIAQFFGDPSAKQVITEYQNRGIPVVGANNNVLGGITKVAEFIKRSPVTGDARLHIFDNCTHLIKEFESYHYNENRNSLDVSEMPAKEYDHALDALRYMIFTYVEPDNDEELGYKPYKRWRGI